jgi:hypothetical protein
MSIEKLVAIGAIFALACGGWWILGTATWTRSTELEGALGAQVEQLWGVPLIQEAPSFAVEIPGSERFRWIMPVANDINVQLVEDYRKKGLIWYPTYTCEFDGTYTIRNDEEVAQKIRVHFDFPAKGGTYDKFAIALDGTNLGTAIDTREGIGEIVELAPNQSAEFQVAYKTRGIREWRYKMDPQVGRVQNLNLVVGTDFRDVDYPDGCLSPMSAEAVKGGMTLTWQASDLITQENIGVTIPEKLNPGPLTSRITFFAPVCLLFFFVLVGTISLLYKVHIHPMHYFFVAAGFFAFHLLLAYMAGIVHIHLAFIISAVVSVAMVTSYLTGALRGAFPQKVAIAGQVFFLVLFSYSFFLDGVTGLTVAIGSVITLAVLMKVTINVDWEQVFVKRVKTPPPLPAVKAKA